MEENPIYKFMRENNLTQLDEQSFIQKYSDPNEAKKIHSFMVQNNLTRLNESDFYSKYLSQQQPSKQGVAPPQETQTSFGSGVRNFLANVNKTALNIPADILETYAVASAFTERMLAKAGVPFADPNVKAEDVSLFVEKPMKAAREYRNMIENIIPVDEEFKSSFAGGVSQGMGQVLGMLATGGTNVASQVPKVAKNLTSLQSVVNAGKEIAKNVFSTQGLVGGSMNASANYRQAIEEGASEEDALQYGIENLVVGSIFENLPIQSMFSRLAKIEPNARVLDIIKNGAVGFSEEGVTESFQTMYENMSAQRIYDVNREMLDGVGEAAAVGGTVGFILNSMASALAGRRARVKNPQEKELIDQALKETEEKIKTVEENNKNIISFSEELGNKEVVSLDAEEGSYDFVRQDNGNLELMREGLSVKEAESIAKSLADIYPNQEFVVENRTDATNPLAKANYTVISRPKQQQSYKIGEQDVTREQAQKAIENAESLEDLEGLSIENDQALMNEVQIKRQELELAQIAQQAVEDESISQDFPLGEVEPTGLITRAGNEVTVKIGGENVSGTVQVDEGGKVTIETPKGTIYEVENDTPFTDFVRPVSITPQGDFEVNGEAFTEARIVVEDGQPKALLIREDGTTKAITNPPVVEEIEYQIALANMESMSDEEADNLLNQYEQQGQTEATTEERVTETDETTADDRKLQEALDEIDLIEQLALEEIEQAETSAKLVEITPIGSKESKVYLVSKNEDGTYSATLNGRKVKRQEVLNQLGQAYETETRNLVGNLQNQVNKLKAEVEANLFGTLVQEKVVVEESPVEEVTQETTEQITEEDGKNQRTTPKTKSTPPSQDNRAKKGKGIVQKIRQLYDKKKPFFDEIKGKFEYPKNAQVARIASDYDAYKAKPKSERTAKEQEFLDFVDLKIKTPYKKPPSQKGKTPLDQRALKGKEAQAASMNPRSIMDVVRQHFLNGARLSNDGLEGLFGQSKQGGGRKSIQRERNARMSYLRTPDKGGKDIQSIVDDIMNKLPVQFENLDQRVVRDAVESVIKDNTSLAQMANAILTDAGLEAESRVKTPIEERFDVRYEDALNEIFTKEELEKATSQEKADALNEYYQIPSGSEYAWTAEMVEQFEAGEINPSVEEIDYAIEMWESMSQEERDLMEQGKLTLDELIAEEQAQPSQEEAPQRVTFSVFGERKKGVKQGDDFISDDGTKYKASMVENVKPVRTIEEQKKLIKDLEKDVKDNFFKGPFDNMGVAFDFKKAMEADARFYDSVVKLIREYVRLKGMQASEVYSNIERILNKKLNPDDRKYLKGIIDTVRKETPKVNVITENKGMTFNEQVKQGLEEILEAKKRDAENKLAQERQKANERLQKAKDKGKARLDEFKNLKKTMIDFLKMDLADIPVSSFTRGEFGKILTQIDKATTDHTVNKAIENAYGIFADAAKRQRVARARGLVRNAKSNIKAGKIGILEPNSLIDQLLRINPNFIPNNIFPLYQSVLQELGDRKTVLSLSERGLMNNDVSAILNEFDLQNNRVDELRDIYNSYENKGKTFSETVDKMLKSDEITSEDAELMRLYKNEIVEPDITEPTPKDINKAIDDAVESVKNISLPDGEYSVDERNIIKTFKLLTKEDLKYLSYQDLVNVSKIVQNINAGRIPNLAFTITTKLNGIKNGNAVSSTLFSFKGSWFNFISSLKAGIKKTVSGKDTSTLEEKIRRNPLFNIDIVIGNFKNTKVYDHLIRTLAIPHDSFDNDINTYNETVRQALLKLPKDGKENFTSRAKLMMLAIQREFESNPNQKGVNTAKAYLDATINAGNNSVYTKQMRGELQKIFDKYADNNGELDSDKLYKDLSKAEKDAYNIVNELNRTMLRPKAMTTSTLIRGNRVPIYENYVHLPRATRGEQKETDIKNLQYTLNKASTRAGSLIERTSSAHPILFDFFHNSTQGAKMTLLDYHMTPAIMTSKSTINHLYRISESDSDFETIKAVDNAISEAMNNIYGVYVNSDNIYEKIASEIMKKGYQAVLSGFGRSASELLSNGSFSLLYKPFETRLGIDVVSKVGDITLSRVASNIPTSQSSRLYTFAGMLNKNIDFSRMNLKEISKNTGYDEGILKKMFKGIKDNKYYEFVDQLQSTILSKPDQIIARPMFWGEFETQFEKITGKKPDYDKIAEADQSYMTEFDEAIKSSTMAADRTMIEAVASSNPWEGIIRNQENPTTKWYVSYVKTFNGFMTRFPTYEYNSAVRAVTSLTGNGVLTPIEGAKLLTALFARLSAYSMLINTALPFLYNLLLRTASDLTGWFEYDEPEEKEKDFQSEATKDILSGLIMLTIHRNMGNVAKAPVNFAIEYANKKYGEGFTYTGNYDSFDDNLAFPLVPLDEEIGRKPIPQTLFENTAGPLSPHVKTIFRTITSAGIVLTTNTEETRDKHANELMFRSTFEVMGNMGYIPFYKDIRKMVLQQMYEQEDKASKAVKQGKTDAIDYSKYK